jgi:hypothetical protein
VKFTVKISEGKLSSRGAVIIQRLCGFNNKFIIKIVLVQYI